MSAIHVTSFVERALRGIEASQEIVASEHDLNDDAIRLALRELLGTAAYYTSALSSWITASDAQNMTFGQKLRALRATTCKSQTEVVQEVAKQFPDLAISQSTLSGLEQREAAPRNEDVVRALAEYYGVPAAYLLGAAAGDDAEGAT